MTGRTTTPAGAIGLLALFAIACTLFSAVVTVLEWSSGKPTVGTDLQIVAVSAIAAVALVALARFLGAREKNVPAEDAPSNGRSIGAAILCFVIAAFIIGAGVWRLCTGAQATSDDVLIIPAGLIFGFAGVMLALPVERHDLRHIFAALMVTAFAFTFDWIAFGPGERHFSVGVGAGGAGVFGRSPEWIGRAVFGLGGIAMTVVAVMMWLRPRLR